MFQAQLRGKLSTEIWQSSEDLLTSAVFGTLKNCSLTNLIRVLGRARALDGNASLTLATTPRWEFWPLWLSCEPDLKIEDDASLIVVEAKLYSDFGEDAGSGSQLNREWHDGLRIANETGKDLRLLTVTNHSSLPEASIRDNLTYAGADFRHVYWLSWFEIGRALKQSTETTDANWVADLLDLMQRMGLSPFDGFTETRQMAQGLAELSWRLEVGKTHFRSQFQSFRDLSLSSGTESHPSWRLDLHQPTNRRGDAPFVSFRQFATEFAGEEWNNPWKTLPIL